LQAHWASFLLGALVAFVILWLNSILVRSPRAWRLGLVAPRKGDAPHTDGPDTDDSIFRDLGGGAWALTEVPPRLLRAIYRLRLPAILALSLFLGAAFESNWWTFLLWLHRQPFHRVDPQFGQDVGFYVFTLPVWSALVSWLTGVFVLALLTTAM